MRNKKKAVWLQVEQPFGTINGKTDWFYCSECKSKVLFSRFVRNPDYKYCPYCGRPMETEERKEADKCHSKSA